MKKITLILILIAAFATQSFAYCPIPQWCPKADLHQTLCPGDTIDPIEFPSVIAKTLIITWWMNETRTNFRSTPPPGITVSGDASTPLGDREYSFPVSIRGTPTATGTHHYTVSNTCGVELLHGSITLNAPIPNTPGTITFNPTTVCPGGTFIASIAAVSDATTYNWTTPASMTDDGSDSTTLIVTNAGTTTGSLAVSVTATNTCGTSAARSQNITVGVAPTIGSVTPSGADRTGLTLNVAFNPALTLTPNPAGTPTPSIQWFSNTTASNSGGTSMGSANGAQTNTFAPPTNIEDIEGVFYYAVATNACGTATTPNTSGRHMVNVTGCNGDLTTSVFTASGNPYFKTDRTWIVGSGANQRTWSDVVIAPYCRAASLYTAGVVTNNPADAIKWGNADCAINSTTPPSGVRPTAMQTSGFSDYYGDLFSWCMVYRFRNLLCPPGGNWRVPDLADFQALQASGATNDAAGVTWLLSTWGGALNGSVITGLSHSTYGYHWTLTEGSGSPPGDAELFEFGSVSIVRTRQFVKGVGFALRCVRDVP